VRGKLNRILTLAAFFCAMGAPAAVQALRSAPANSLVIMKVTVIDATGAPAKTDFTVIVRDGRIAELGPSARVRIPEAAQMIEARGK